MKYVILFAALLGCVQLSLGWGKTGHQIIAQIASDLLTDTATKIIYDFIGDRTLPDIAPIPDEYDHTAEGNWSKPCHFCNLPRDATNFTMADCPGFCVVKSIFNYTDILERTQRNPTPCSFESGAEPCALIFLVHFVGDVHQPLHVGYGYDEGGNLVPVTWFGEQTFLHPVWDDSIIEKWTYDFEDGAKALEEMMQNETELVDHYISVTNAIDWADESFHYVRSTCYNFTDNGQDYEFDLLDFEDVPALSTRYYDVNLPIVQQRLIAAGVRLATLLNKILVG